jgi:hypothetical protein
MKKITSITGAAAAAAVLALTGAQGGCGSSSSGSSGPTPGATTAVAEQGAPSPLKCTLTLISHHPVDKRLTATLTVSCNFTVASADARLSILGKPLGSDDTNWDTVVGPQESSDTEDISLSLSVLCITSLDYQASGSIDALAEDGTPVDASDATTPLHYSPSECSGS